MTWLIVLALVLVVGGTVVVASGRYAPMAPVHGDRPGPRLPRDRAMTAADLDDVRFTTAVVGYRTDEVDALLARLRAEWTARDNQEATVTAPDPTEADRAG